MDVVNSALGDILLTEQLGDITPSSGFGGPGVQLDVNGNCILATSDNSQSNSSTSPEAKDQGSSKDGSGAERISRRRSHGQIRFVSDDDNSEESDSDLDFVGPSQPAQRDPNPDLSRIDSNDIKQHILEESGRWPLSRRSRLSVPTMTHLIHRREIGMSSREHFTSGNQCLFNSRFLPNRSQKLAHYHHKVFCGQFSQQGDIFLSACQDQNIRIYDTMDSKFELKKTIRARDVGWSVLDVAFSPDSNYLIYSSWSDCIHLCNIHGDHEVHEPLLLCPGEHSFCIFSLMFSADNHEIIGGANDGCLYIYDRESNQRTLKIDAHDDDVNAVCFADDSSQILYSGGDDGLCKVWDRRTLSENSPTPVGTMAGHIDGITFIDTKNDARYFVSNSKDQSIKLWDVRCFSTKEAVDSTKKVVSSQKWDYRWQQVPKRVTRKKSVSGDSSVMTYRGHSVLHTLVRCRFSPKFTTGQRFIYSGCASGNVVVYDVLTGKVVKFLEGCHRSCVRDISWHPFENTIISASWDGTVAKWEYFDYWTQTGEEGEEKLPFNLREDEDDQIHTYHTRHRTRLANHRLGRQPERKESCFQKLYD